MNNTIDDKLKPSQVVVLILVLVGLLISVTLVQQRQHLRSRAQALYNAFEVLGDGVERVDESTWNTKSLDIHIRVVDLQSLQ